MEDNSFLVTLDFRLFEKKYYTSETYQTIYVKLIKERGNWFIDDFLCFDEDQNGDKYSTSWKKQMLDFIAEE